MHLPNFTRFLYLVAKILFGIAVMTELKLGPATKLDKRNTTTSRRFDDDVVSGNYDVIFIFPING